MKRGLLIAAEVLGWAIAAFGIIFLLYGCANPYHLRESWLLFGLIASPGFAIVALSRKYRRRLSEFIRCPRCRSLTERPASFCPACGNQLNNDFEQRR